MMFESGDRVKHSRDPNLRGTVRWMNFATFTVGNKEYPGRISIGVVWDGHESESSPDVSELIKITVLDDLADVLP